MVFPIASFYCTSGSNFHSSLLSLIIEQGEINPRQIKLLQNMKADPEYYQEEVEYYERKLQSISNEKTSY